jgi:hypothetical protein
MKLEVSVGEAIDKYCILEIKRSNIKEESKLNDINKELIALKECEPFINEQKFLYNLLIYINTEIWNMTNEIKLLDVKNEKYSIISKKIFDFNQKRFRAKNMFNSIFNSDIIEQKSYFTTYCELIIDNDELIYDKISEINYLLFEYDCLLVDKKYLHIFHNIFIKHNILPFDDGYDNNIIEKIILNNYKINETIKDTFTFKPITYASSGRLGDFIQTLSVINETFYNTGKKGIVYIRNDETFSNGLIKTHSDTYQVIKSQKYIYDYKIYQNENIDIDLDKWFLNKDLLYRTNWINIFTFTYNINWGKTKWLNLPYDKKWEDKVLINIMHYRKSVNIDFNKLYNRFSDSLVFISFNKTDYEEFVKDTNLNIENYTPNSFTEACIAINSCKLLVASLSGILTIGHACHKNRLIGLCGSQDDVHNTDFNLYWGNVFYCADSVC